MGEPEPELWDTDSNAGKENTSGRAAGDMLGMRWEHPR